MAFGPSVSGAAGLATGGASGLLSGGGTGSSLADIATGGLSGLFGGKGGGSTSSGTNPNSALGFLQGGSAGTAGGGTNFLTGSPSASQATSSGLRNVTSADLLDLLNPSQGGIYQGLANQSLTYDPAQTQSISQTLAQYSDPNYLNVASNPYVQGLESSLTNQSNTNEQNQLATLRSQFGGAGQTSTSNSSPLAQASAASVSQNQNNLNNTIAQALFGQYQQNQNLQQQGISQASQYNLTPANLLAQLAPLTASSRGAVSSPLSAIGQLIGSIGSAAGGLAGAFCWVAREVYGAENPKWVSFRSWLITKAPQWLFHLYFHKGERFAAWLHKNPWAKPPVKWVMDTILKGEK